MSAIGVMFAPHHQLAADELVRVCRPGGTIGLLSWTPEGMIGGLFRTMGPFAPPPPPGAQPPPLWGGEAHLRELLGDRVDARPRRARRARRHRLRAPARLRRALQGALRARRSPPRPTPATTGREAEFEAALDAFCDEWNRAARADRRGSRWSTCSRVGTRAAQRSAPRRSAAAPASRREPTPSLPSTAETWWSTVLARDHQLAGDLRVGRAPHDQLQHLGLARRQARRADPRGGARAARDPLARRRRAAAAAGGPPSAARRAPRSGRARPGAPPRRRRR